MITTFPSGKKRIHTGFPLNPLTSQVWDNSEDIPIDKLNSVHVYTFKELVEAIKQTAKPTIVVHGNFEDKVLSLTDVHRLAPVVIVPADSDIDKRPSDIFIHNSSHIRLSGFIHTSKNKTDPRIRIRDGCVDVIIDNDYIPAFRYNSNRTPYALESERGKANVRCAVQRCRGEYFGPYDASYIHLDVPLRGHTANYVDCWFSNNVAKNWGDLIQAMTWGALQTALRAAHCNIEGIFIASNTGISTFSSGFAGGNNSPENVVDLKGGAKPHNRGVVFGNLGIGLGRSSSDAGICVVLHFTAFNIDVRSNMALGCGGCVSHSDYMESRPYTNSITDNFAWRHPDSEPWKSTGKYKYDGQKKYHFSLSWRKRLAGKDGEYNMKWETLDYSNIQKAARNISIEGNEGSYEGVYRGPRESWKPLTISVPDVHLKDIPTTYTIEKALSPESLMEGWVWLVQDNIKETEPMKAPNIKTLDTEVIIDDRDHVFYFETVSTPLQAYNIEIGTTLGGSEIFWQADSLGATSPTELIVFPVRLPELEGTPIYTRLWYKVDESHKWETIDARFETEDHSVVETPVSGLRITEDELVVLRGLLSRIAG